MIARVDTEDFLSELTDLVASLRRRSEERFDPSNAIQDLRRIVSEATTACHNLTMMIPAAEDRTKELRSALEANDCRLSSAVNMLSNRVSKLEKANP